MKDEWFFEIGDGNQYGPYPLEKLRKWAAAGNLMPTHRVRHAESEEWVIAAYVDGLELTTTAEAEKEAVPKKAKRRLPFGFSKKDDESSDGATIAKPQKSPVEICDELMETAFARRASDVHVDPEEHMMLFQLRIDGVLEPLLKLPKELHAPVVSRFKVLAGMDIAEKREAQDGQFKAELGGEKQKIDVRVACLPTTHGERLTMRLLAVEAGKMTLNRLGMSEIGRKLFTETLAERQGMLLVTGPTGSGKSTTLYASLRHRLAAQPGRIITVEDPVEYDIVGVAQVEVDAADKVAFGSVLRNILRSDPDVIMIGEMRDYESADIGVKAALTGHLVISSLHTNSAAGAVTRLIDMGVEPFLVAATLRLCVAQRLIRRLCPKCRTRRELTAAEAEAIARPSMAGATIYDPGGCERCNQLGYKGRVAVYELLPISFEMQRLITGGFTEKQLFDAAKDRGAKRLVEDAVDKLLAGTTSLAEVVTLGPIGS